MNMNIDNNDISNAPEQEPVVEPTPEQEPVVELNQAFKPNSERKTNVNVRCPRCGTFSATRFCGKCGFDIESNFILAMQNHQFQKSPNAQNQYQINAYNQTNKKKNKVIIIIATIVFILLAICGICLMLLTFDKFGDGNNDKKDDNIQIPVDEYFPDNKYGNTDGKSTPQGASEDEVKQIKIGMTYARISGIIGGDGDITGEGENVKKEQFYTFSWRGENNPEGELHITFIDGVATEIVERGIVEE